MAALPPPVKEAIPFNVAFNLSWTTLIGSGVITWAQVAPLPNNPSFNNYNVYG